jgi:DNA-binding NtrC family response regulator
MPARVLIVEDESMLSESIKHLLKRDGHEVDTVSTGEACLDRIQEVGYDLVLSDIILPGMDGIRTLQQLRARVPDQVVVLMTAHPTLDTAVRALRAGAFDYIIKPIINEELRRTVRNALSVGALRVEREVLCRQVEERWDNEQIVGTSPAMQALRAEVGKVSGARSNVLLLGETGTGKELFARAIHACSPRGDKPFVPVNCSAIPEQLLESEIFGYQRGAFTGATVAKRGLLEEADGGTVFLDEIGEMGQHLQSKLLRVLDDRQIRPLGAVHSRQVDVRFIAATNLHIAPAVETGAFRPDLYYRLSVITFTLPPLRIREGDVPLLARHFLRRFARELGRDVDAIDDEALRMLESHSWPGNVRELQNVIERAVLVAAGRVILPEHLPGNLRAAPPPVDPPPLPRGGAPEGGVLSIEDYTRALITACQADHTEQQIAAMLGITRKALWEKRRRWGMQRA